jgi:lysophospholipase L1-like esterase
MKNKSGGINSVVVKREMIFKRGSTLLKAMSISCLAVTYAAQAQDTISFNYKSFGLESDINNVIRNEGHLDDFYESLFQLKKGLPMNVNVVHIGDSHIQADFLTNSVRRNFQKEFGNAGRGLIVPGRVAGTNEPFNIQTSSTAPWKGKRGIFINDPTPIGIGGITITTDQPNTKLYIYMNDLWLDYSFNTVTLFYQKDITSFNISVKDSSYAELGSFGPYSSEPFSNYAKLKLPYLTGGLVLELVKTAPEQSQATIFGINLENGKNGLLYHSIGINGAKYAHYNAALYFAKQTRALVPDLFIISLGTNEALDFPYLDKNFTQHVDKLISSLREYNPTAKIILVTPPEVFRKKIKMNPGIPTIRQQIIQYAVENGLAFWDMYKALGGENSAQAWRKAALLRDDGIHYTRDGYDYQGNLLYYALIKGYNNYVRDRHP